MFVSSKKIFLTKFGKGTKKARVGYSLPVLLKNASAQG